MSTIIPLILAAGAGALFVWFWSSRLPSPGSKLPYYVLVYDGSAWSLRAAKAPPAGGNVSIDGAEYSPGLLRYVEGAEAQGMRLYVMPVEAVVLADHKALEKARKSIITGALFKTGGDLVQMVQIGGACVVLAVGIYMWMVVGNVSSALAEQNVILQKVSDIVSKPLVVAPGVE